MAEALKKRSTAGSIGSSSNTYSLMLSALEENSAITNPFVKDDLSTFFFQSIKQGPISAAKLKGAQEMDLVRALGIDSKLRGSMRQGGSFDDFYASMRQLAMAADGSDRTAFHDYLVENRETLQAFHSGFDRKGVNAAVQALTTPADKAFAGEVITRLGPSPAATHNTLARARHRPSGSSPAESDWIRTSPRICCVPPPDPFPETRIAR